MIFKRKQPDFWEGTINPKRTFYTQYGRAINLTTGLIVGLLIDKLLFYITKGFSSFIPPVSVLLMNKGMTITTIRFNTRYNKYIERILGHIIVK